MDSIPFIISLLFGGISLVYTTISFYGLSLNFNSKNNRLFFLMTLSLAFWGICYAITSLTDSKEIALKMSQLTVFGWGLFYSLILHFIKSVATGKRLRLGELIFLYAPPAFFIYTFLLADTAPAQFNITYSKWGYTTSSPSTVSNNLFMVYALLYSVLCVKELISWHNRIQNEKTKGLIKLTTLASAIAIVLASLTDYLMRNYLNILLPQSTILWLILPILSFFYLLLKSKFIHEDFDKNFNSIIDDKSKQTVFRIVGYIYILLAYGTFFIHYSHDSVLDGYQIIISVVALIFAFAHIFLTSFTKKQEYQYLVITLLYTVIISLFAYIYAENMAITVWAIFFCYMILVTIFERVIYGFFMSAYMIFLQVIMWIHLPDEIPVDFDWSDHFARILIITLFSYLTFYINYAYRKKVKENLLQISAQNVIKNFSNEMQSISIHNANEKIASLLGLINEGFDIKRSTYIHLNKDDNEVFERGYTCEDNEISKLDGYASTIFALNPKWLQEVKLNNIVSYFNIFLEFKNSEDEVCMNVKDAFERRGITGFYSFPILYGSKLRGIGVFEFSFSEENKLLHSYLEILKTLTSEALDRLDSQRALFTRANFDSVTGLRSKDYFLEAVDEILEREEEQSCFMLYIDIDSFNSINDTFGHSTGDEVLKNAAEIFSKEGPEEKLLTRFTNDEFAVFFYGACNRDTVTMYCARTVELFKKGINISGNNFRLNIFIGISSLPKDGTQSNDLLKNAALAMNSSKKLGYIKHHFCDETDKRQTFLNSIYTDRLYSALDNGEFKLAYQPQVDTFSEHIIGVEALLRWESEEFGFVPPFKFIPILEHTGLIISVGEWIIEECIREQKRIEEAGFGKIRFSINLSAAQFMDTTLIQTIYELKEKYRVDPEFLEFEITESVAINNSDFVLDSFNSLKEMCFTIAIDDFGTGFSSLNSLQNLPIDRLKIDKSFIDGIGMNDKRESIVNLVIELAKILNLHSIAEGVEVKSQLDYLRERGCEEIQGYYYAKPMFPDELRNFLKSFHPEESAE
ncbi:MAG: EAL domain-containing protein [Bacillota bacterium]|nr:EAL domain-containing protein [Bacillota bacterium]